MGSTFRGCPERVEALSLAAPSGGGGVEGAVQALAFWPGKDGWRLSPYLFGWKDDGVCHNLPPQHL